MATTIRLKRDLAVDWNSRNPRLDPGEPGFESDTGRLKVGNGRTAWQDLPYYVPSSEMQRLIDDAVAEADIGGSGQAHEELVEHVNSLNPHPVYDSGPSLLLLYQNAKV